MAPIPIADSVVQDYRGIGRLPRPVTFSQVDMRNKNNNTITLHLVRHGQGQHNKEDDLWKKAGREGIRPFAYENREKNKHLIDAKLTPQGIQEALALRPKLAKTSPTLCVISPLRR